MKRKEFYIIQREWTETLQGAELLLYAYIHNTCEKCGTCECSKANLAYWTGIGERWLNKPLASLKERGLITIEERAGKYSIYRANPYTKSVPLHLKCTPTLKVGDTPALKVYPPTIINTNNINNNTKNKEKTKSAYAIEDFCPADWLPVLQMWLDYKKQRKETYKTESSVKICLKHLQELAGGNIETGRKIVEQAMANNWAGLYALKTQIKPTPAQGTDASEVERIKQQYIQRQQAAQADDLARAAEDKAASQLAAQEFAKHFKITY